MTDAPEHLHFTPCEQQLLDFFMSHPGKWFGPKTLVTRGLGFQSSVGKFGDSQTLRWHVKNLRRKISLGEIQGRRTSFDGRPGYRWRFLEHEVVEVELVVLAILPEQPDDAVPRLDAP